jgi:hypothetical protein
MSKGTHWGQYYKYKLHPLAQITENAFKVKIAVIEHSPKPFIRSSVLINEVLTEFGQTHVFHRQFREQFPGFDKESVLGVQLYELLYPQWHYAKTQFPRHKFEHSCYWK